MKLAHIVLLGSHEIGQDLNSLFSARQPATIETVSDERKRIHLIRSLAKAQIITADIGNQTELVCHDSDKLKRETQKIIQGVS